MSQRSTFRASLAALIALALVAGCASPGLQGPGHAGADGVATAGASDAADGASEPAVTVSAAASAPDLAAPAAAAAASAPADASVAAIAPVDDAAAPVPVDPLRPESAVDLNDSNAHADLWGRVRHGFAMPDLESELVRSAEQWYATRPDYVKRMTERGSRYLFHIVEEVERRGMPTELALLPFIESAFNPTAVSSAKASGMWQFMPATGRDFDLTQNLFRDDRRNVLASTRAALDYLERLHKMFGDWHLALAAYNWGEGNVQRAIQRNQRAGLPLDYVSLRMPNETQYYVPKLQAVKNLIARPDSFGLALPEVANHPYFLSVPITRDIDVSLAARFAGMSEDDFKALNPQMNKPVILAAGTPQVLLPYDNADRFVKSVAEHKGPLATWTAWVALKTLRPADAAKQVGMSESDLREVNRIPPRMLVKAGSTLLVPRTAQRSADVSEHIADNAMMALAPERAPARRVAFKAGKRESVATVARRYRVSTSQVAEWNHVPAGASFKQGQTVIVYLAGKISGTARASSTTRKSVAVSASKPKSSVKQVRASKPAKVTRKRAAK